MCSTSRSDRMILSPTIMRAIVGVLALAAGGCFSKPGFNGPGSDGGDGPDADDSHAPHLRLISTAYAGSHEGNPVVRSSLGMTATTWEITAGGIADGDLLLFIANVDNGDNSNSIWRGLDTLGFSQLVQNFYNGGDGQTFIVDWKIAAGEPGKYTGTFGNGVSSAAATIMLLAVTGYDPARMTPIADSIYANEPGMTGTMPSTATSPGVTTTVADTLLVWATGSDWLSAVGGSNTFTAPTGFTSLMTLGDHGNPMFDWTSEQIAYHVQTQPGFTGQIQGTLTGTVAGTPWDVVLAIPPPPL